MKLFDLTLHPRSELMAKRLIDNMPHALVVEGPSGIGAMTVATAIANELGATVPFIIRPKKKVKTEFVVNMNEGSVIIDDIRELYQQTRTFTAEKRVIIIDTGEKSMTTGAQNAFLKLLEEPREGTYFIIATHHVDQLLPTITSRSQKLTLLPVTSEQTSQIIDELGITDAVKKTRLAFVGNGLPALIKRLADDENAYESRVAIVRDAKMMLGSDTYEKIVTIHRYRDARLEALTLIDDMNHQIRTILSSQPNSSASWRIAMAIDTNLDIRAKIAAGGNIRLHLTSGVV